MMYSRLIRESNRYLSAHPTYVSHIKPATLFSDGGKWMAHMQHGSEHSTILRSRNIEQDEAISKSFTFYGMLKYGICCTAFLASLILLCRIHPLLAPLAVAIFYITEVHFLFLFPLLIDGSNNPLWESIKMTYRIGLLRALLTVLPIGLYMVGGLLYRHHPFKRWHAGCLAIIIWYRHEVNNRI